MKLKQKHVLFVRGSSSSKARVWFVAFKFPEKMEVKNKFRVSFGRQGRGGRQSLFASAQLARVGSA
jgi:hypothetical protein